MKRNRIAILGGGPIGLEAAVIALERGYDAHVYERDVVGGNVRRWGHVRLFSSFALNHSERGARLLAQEGVALPPADAYLTGAEYVERYLKPLSRTGAVAGAILEHRRVVSMGRDGIGKADLLGGPRERHPFRLLVEDDSGREELATADIVLDCSGTYGNHNWMGSGNVPALGERALEKEITYELEDLSGCRGRRVLLVGDGYSAATTLDALRSQSGTTVDWVARKREPLPVIPNDPLPERERLSVLVGALAAGADPGIRFHPECGVESVRRGGAAFEVTLRADRSVERVVVDRILAYVGYHPDSSLYRELQVHQCYASSAPMNLAAALLGESSADCLTQTSKGADVLKNPEPNFFILGAKSYGRGSTFLIRTGLQQVEEVFGLLSIEAAQERAS